MDDTQLLRYSRQILLPEIDLDGQEQLLASRVLIIGMGGLGSPVAMYLAAAGIGHLVLADFDSVELSNLQRQIIHHSDDMGRPKVDSAHDRVMALNPETKVTTIGHRMTDVQLLAQAKVANVVVDASDNFATRFAINTACHAARTALVSGAALRFTGQVTVLFPGRGDSPCYRCLYSDEPEEEERCADTGVVAPLLGVIGSVQAMETLKLVAGIGESLKGRLLLLEALDMQWREIRFARDPDCPVCST